MIVHARAAQRFAQFGDIDVASVLAAFYSTVEIRTRLGPPVTINLASAAGGAPDPNAGALVKEIQPALVFKGNAGSWTIAPAGMPSGVSKLVGQFGVAGGILFGGIALGLLALGYGVGYYMGGSK